MTKWPRLLASIVVILAVLGGYKIVARAGGSKTGAAAGWHKYSSNPVLGGELGTCFDISVLKKANEYLMWFSWRPKQSIALVKSRDGVHWTNPIIVLGPNRKSGWEDDISRPAVIERSAVYHMWYTGQAHHQSWVGYAISKDGIHWKRMSQKPVLSPAEPWEKVAVMCPDVIWDSNTKVYRMWYSGGDNYEPNAIGYATSPDGLHWTKFASNPIFRPDANNPWEQQRVTACQVIHADGWYYMFYIGFRDIDHAQIGLARSKDGISDWQRLPENPIIRAGIGNDAWDHDACYKPYAVWDGSRKRWLLWYNGRNGHFEQIGLAIHYGKNLGFPDEHKATAGGISPRPSVAKNSRTICPPSL